MKKKELFEIVYTIITLILLLALVYFAFDSTKTARISGQKEALIEVYYIIGDLEYEPYKKYFYYRVQYEKSPTIKNFIKLQSVIDETFDTIEFPWVAVPTKP